MNVMRHNQSLSVRRRMREAPSGGRGAGAGGFTLVELLLAMFILGIGLAAIASVFPVASYLQKSAVQGVDTLHVATSAESILRANPIPASALTASDTEVQQVSNLSTHLPLSMRAYPQQSLTGAAADERDMYWVPLAQNVGTSAAPEWRVFVFIMTRRGDGDVPDVQSSNASGSNNGDGTANISANDGGGYFQIGDPILSHNGQVFEVADVNGDTLTVNGQITGDLGGGIWYGRSHAANRAGPAQRIIVLGSEAVQ